MVSPSRKPVLPVPGHNIDSDVREFIDTVLVPMLVKDALRDLSPENLACTNSADATEFRRSGNE